VSVSCAEVRDLIHPFLDGELEVEKNVELLKHFELCPPCSARKAAEGQLQARIEGACAEALPDDARSRIFAAALERVGAEEAAPPGGGEVSELLRPPSLWRRALAAAAVVLVAGGAGWLGHANPFCWGGCPTARMVEQAYVQAQEATFVGDCDAPELSGTPHCVGLERVGYTLVKTDGVHDRPMVVYACKRSGKRVRYFRIPGGHTHSGSVHADGRRYMQTRLPDGTPVVGWEDRKGGVSLCLPAGGPESPRLDAQGLLLMATSLRDSEPG
jgi:anti-sigma factor (TIGR02949 family)